MDDVLVQKTIEQDGVARMTVSKDGSDHRFTVAIDGEMLSIEHEESHCWRGRIDTSEPPEEIFDALVESREFREYVNRETERLI